LVDDNDAYKYTYGTQKKIRWKCDKHGEYLCSVSNRTRSSAGCNKCAIEYRAEKKKIGALEKAYRAFVRASIRYNKKNELQFRNWRDLVLEICFYCGSPHSEGRKIAGYELRINGIDRIDNIKGYLRTNVVSCCWMCNKMKHTTPQRAFLDHVSKIHKHGVTYEKDDDPREA